MSNPIAGRLSFQIEDAEYDIVRIKALLAGNPTAHAQALHAQLLVIARTELNEARDALNHFHATLAGQAVHGITTKSQGRLEPAIGS